jgi:hypothetical protein
MLQDVASQLNEGTWRMCPKNARIATASCSKECPETQAGDSTKMARFSADSASATATMQQSLRFGPSRSLPYHWRKQSRGTPVDEPIRISARATPEDIVQRKWVKPSKKYQWAEVIIGFLAGAFVIGGLYLAYVHFRWRF